MFIQKLNTLFRIKKWPFIFILFCLKLQAQNYSKAYVDSIYSKALLEKGDTNQVAMLFAESSKILKKKPQEAKTLLNKTLAITNAISDKKWLGKNKSLLGTLEYGSGNFTESEIYFKEALEIYKKSNIVSGQATVLNNLASLYRDKGDYTQATEYYLKSLKIKEDLNDKKGIVNTLNNLANLHVANGHTETAQKYYNQARDIAEQTKNPESLAITYSNLANVYFDANDVEKSYQYDTLALYYRKKTGDKSGIAISLHNISSYFNSKKNYEMAMKYVDEALKIKAELGDKQGTCVSKAEKGTIFLNMHQPDSSIKYINEALSIAKNLSLKKRIAVCYQNMAKAYANKKDYITAYEYERKYSDLKDSVSNENYQKTVSEMETKYDTDKKKKEIELLTKESRLNVLMLRERELESIGKEKEIELLNTANKLAVIQNEKNEVEIAHKKIEIDNNQKQLSLLNQKKEIQDLEIKNHQAHIKQQKIVTYFIVTGLILAIGLAFFIFNGLKKQRKANKIISVQKQEVEKQKTLVEEHQKEILDSIHYAKRIQNTLIAHHEFIDENLSNNFVFFKPKDIVSGDFYWATKHGANFYLSVCDSTGHGVPGAFMSLLNIGFLNEAINEKDILEPNQVFNYVRSRLISTISKEGQQDGFDGILICVNQVTRKITYAAANNAPILISDNQIIELSKDKMPVGIGEWQQEFRIHEIGAKPGDVLYLYTDGYADQFGGDKGKKFKYKPLNELLLSLTSKPLSEQKEILQMTFDNWKGNLEQVDDVCVIGIKL